ncbi:hypothetical protein PAAG_00009 [Paracoccidioides lutzii Pb01]|uniref:Uncharacterized protein n=1 Tax=Paracoccidioides lutzii (strain ATCC MYA-826 / Pb01) TaxID=502779 RepID=C1GNB4_PARBA|nr:hypothetical protein PAAG_00009 [Paracoccidioides lutzii Pb01]EEH35686.1 hypothetical protein PAAG_00009 [Paracoccidioides lutzii Pb01]
MPAYTGSEPPRVSRSLSVRLPSFAELDAASQTYESDLPNSTEWNRNHADALPTMGRPSEGHGWRDYRRRGLIPIIAVQLEFDTAAFDFRDMLMACIFALVPSREAHFYGSP